MFCLRTVSLIYILKLVSNYEILLTFLKYFLHSSISCWHSNLSCTREMISSLTKNKLFPRTSIFFSLSSSVFMIVWNMSWTWVGLNSVLTRSTSSSLLTAAERTAGWTEDRTLPRRWSFLSLRSSVWLMSRLRFSAWRAVSRVCQQLTSWGQTGHHQGYF